MYPVAFRLILDSKCRNAAEKRRCGLTPQTFFVSLPTTYVGTTTKNVGGFLYAPTLQLT